VGNINNEFRLPAHKGPKAILFDYDFITELPDGDDRCLYCLSAKEVQLILTLAEYIGWERRWLSPSGATISKDVIDALQGSLIEELMTDHCDIDTLLTDIKDQVDAIKADTNTIKGDTSSLKADMTIVKTNLTTIKANTDLLELHLLAQDTAIGLIATDLTALSAAVALDSAAIAGIASLLTTTSSEVHDVHVQVDEIDEDVDAIETTVNSTATEVTETGADVDNIELLVTKMKQQVTYQNTTVTINNVLNVYSSFASQNASASNTEVFARYNAFCQGIMDWIYGETAVVQEAIGASVSDVAAILAFLVSGGASIGMTSYGPAGQTSAAIQTAITSLTDVQAVACYMITYLQNKPLTYASFKGSLTSFAPANSNQTVLQAVLLDALAHYDAFSAYVGNIDAEYQIALSTSPTYFDCAACGVSAAACLAVTTTWNFDQGDKFPWIITRGKYLPGVGIIGMPLDGDGTNVGIDMYLPMPGGSGCTGQTKWEFTGKRLSSGYVSQNNSLLVHYQNTLGTDIKNSQNGLGSLTADGVLTFNWASGTVWYNYIRYCTANSTPAYPEQTAAGVSCGYALIKQIKITHI
jgi:peptidoglycan hydrolase CwlO-like protein